MRYIIALLVFSASVRAADVVEQKYADDKAIKSRYTVVADGKKSGPYWLYFENGKLQETGKYANDQLDGERHVYFENGKLKTREDYRAGELHGSVEELNDRGEKVKTAEYRQGELNGVYREYADGVATLEQVYVGGDLVYPRSRAMMTATIAKIRAAKIETAKPDPDKPIPPHRGSKVSQEDRENAVRLLMEYRYLCAVPYEGLQLDPAYCAHDEAAVAILDELKKLDHNPPNPGWPDAEYQFAKSGCGHSNLYAGGGGSVASVSAYMNDSDPSNIDRLGHRRWCINPAMGRVGFAASGAHSAMWSFDGSRQEIPDWNFVACPAQGLYPADRFDSRSAWSVSLNPKKFRKPSKDSVKLSITPAAISLSEGAIKPSGKPLKIDYFNVNLDGFGVPNCIIFRPESLSTATGTAYLVEIEGLKQSNGTPAKLRYVVEFYRSRKGY
jgi:hypothetical protein